MPYRAFGVMVVAALLLAAPAQAGTSPYLGPIPYLSAADSPFDLGAGFCLEDFEDGVFDVPGASGNGTVLGPGGLTDSVDADDGTIDGFGTSGHSYFGGSGPTGITITFDPVALGGSLPTAAGMVWTDGNGTISFEAFDADGVSLGVYGPFDHADASNSGTTGEDRFYGVTNAGGISAIKLTNTSGGIEVDHVQYDGGCDVAMTTTTTTTPTSSTTSTTLGGCAGEPVAATFASIDCRLADLIAAVEGEPQLGAFQPKLDRSAGRARDREQMAAESCAAGSTKAAKRQLKKVVRKLVQFSHRLRSGRARKRVPEEVRTPLTDAASGIQEDVRQLRDTVACTD
jgi:hypothetical protein